MAHWSAILPAADYSASSAARRWDVNLTIPGPLIFGGQNGVLHVVNLRIARNDVILNLVNPRRFTTSFTSQGTVQLEAGGASFRFNVTEADSLDTTDPYIWSFSGDKQAELIAFRNTLPSSSTVEGRITLWDGIGESPFVALPDGTARDLDIAITIPTVNPPRPPGEWVMNPGDLAQIGSNTLTLASGGNFWPPFDADWFTVPLSDRARTLQAMFFTPSSVSLTLIGPIPSGALRTDRLASLVLDDLTSGRQADFGPWDATNDEFGDSQIALTSAEGNAYATLLVDWSEPNDIRIRIRDRVHRGELLDIAVGLTRPIYLPPPLAIELEWLVPRAPTAIATTLPLAVALTSPHVPLAALPADIGIEIGLPRPVPSHEALGEDIGVAIDLPAPRAPVTALGQALPLTLEFDQPSARFIAVARALDLAVGFTPPVAAATARGADLPISVGLPSPLLTAVAASDLPLQLTLTTPRAPVAAIPETFPLGISLSTPRSDAIALGRVLGIDLRLPSPRAPVTAILETLTLGIGLPRPLLRALPGVVLDLAVEWLTPRAPVTAQAVLVSVEAQWLTPGVGVAGVPLALSIDLSLLTPRSEHPAHATPLPVALRWLRPAAQGVGVGLTLPLGLRWLDPEFPGAPIILPTRGDLRLGFAAWSAIQIWSGGAGVQDTSLSSQTRAVARPVGVQYWTGEFTTPPISLRSRRYRVLRNWIDGLHDGLRPTILTFPPGGPGPTGVLSVIATSVESHGVERGVDQGYTVRWEQVI